MVEGEWLGVGVGGSGGGTWGELGGNSGGGGRTFELPAALCSPGRSLALSSLTLGWWFGWWFGLGWWSLGLRLELGIKFTRIASRLSTI